MSSLKIIRPPRTVANVYIHVSREGAEKGDLKPVGALMYPVYEDATSAYPADCIVTDLSFASRRLKIGEVEFIARFNLKSGGVAK